MIMMHTMEIVLLTLHSSMSLPPILKRETINVIGGIEEGVMLSHNCWLLEVGILVV
jgi:hypothetical protein